MASGRTRSTRKKAAWRGRASRCRGKGGWGCSCVRVPAALPVLLEHLERGGYPDRVMESLGRALAVKPSVAFWDRLKARYLASRNLGEEDGTAVALAACATEAQLDDLLAFLRRGTWQVAYLLHPPDPQGRRSARP